MCYIFHEARANRQYNYFLLNISLYAQIWEEYTLTFFTIIFLSPIPSRSFLFTIRIEGCLLEHNIRLIDSVLFYVRRTSRPIPFGILFCLVLKEKNLKNLVRATLFRKKSLNPITNFIDHIISVLGKVFQLGD